MARKSSPPASPSRPELKIPLDEARRRLQDRVAKGRELMTQEVASNWPTRVKDYERWTAFNADLLRSLLSTDELAQEYEWSAAGDLHFQAHPGDDLQYSFQALRSQVDSLESIIERLELFPVAGLPQGSTAAKRGGPTEKPDRHRTPLDVLEHLANRFHIVAQQLRARYGNRETLKVSDEYDVQDLLHGLLLLEFEDVRPEEHTPSYGGGSSRMDFLLKVEQIVVEVKCARPGLGPKQLGEELLVDIAKYQAHPECKTLFCFVYDPAGLLNNPRGLETDLSHGRHGLPTRVRIRPNYS
jgi:hypothetical protein